VESLANKSDIMTKNLQLKLFEENSKNLLEGNIMHKVMTMIIKDVNSSQRENILSHISKFGIGFDLDQHGNTPNPTGTEARNIEKVNKQDLQEEDNKPIPMTDFLYFV
jgi:hypothetical protein